MDVSRQLHNALSERYRIERELGQGGMATVYLAADLKHDRKVAIKVLKPELAAVLGAERFVVEIKTTAALSHPHILPLFDSGEADGFLYYVMPYIEGETIRERLNRETQLGVDEAVKIATEVADALDYAHRHGVIHRDIKPENILLHDKRPMVMDFGIALALSAAAGGRMTETGLSLGTPHYMSPEQATADKDISARSDVYSLASVLYEMLTGQPPHDGGSAQQVIMRIITDTPRPVTELRKSVPRHVAAAVAKALEKLPADRFTSAREFADALMNPAFTTIGAAAAAADGVRVFGRQRPWRTILVAGAFGGALGGALLTSFAWAFARKPSLPASNVPVLRAELNILTRSDSGVYEAGLDMSPDGSMLVYAARGPGMTAFQLYLRRLDDRTARPIPGTEGGMYPTFSPNGASIAFVHDNNAIRRIPVNGGVAQNIVQTSGRTLFIYDPRWAADGFIYYSSVVGPGDGELARVSAQGGTPQVFPGVAAATLVEPLPGGRHVLYASRETEGDVRALNVETGATQSLGLTAREVRYVASGHLLLIGTEAIKAVPFDPTTLAMRGEPRAVLDSVTASGSVSDFKLAANGTAAYLIKAGTGGTLRSAALVDLAGNEQRIPLAEANFYEFRFSPDGRRIAYRSSPGGNYNTSSISVHDLVVGTTLEIARGGGEGFSRGLVWLPGSPALLFHINQADTLQNVALAHLDGSGKIDTLWSSSGTSEFLRLPRSVTQDGKHVLLDVRGADHADLQVASLDSVLGEPRDYLTARWHERSGKLSPDGRWVVYESNEEAPPSEPFRFKVYVRSFPEPGERYTVSDSLGITPQWAPDGKTIYYWRDRTVVAASVNTAPSFVVTARRDLFTRGRASTGYDISPNGKQFVMTAPSASATGPSEESQPTRLVVVGNWIEELRRKLGEQR